MDVQDRYRIEVRMPCGHGDGCVIDRFSADTKAASTAQLAEVLETELASMVRRRRVRRDGPAGAGDWF